MTNPNRNKRKRADPLREGATQSTPKPGDFPLGSMASRAAARAMSDAKRDQKPDRLTGIQIVYGAPGGPQEYGPLIKIPPV
jgi:hypothetical protein